MLATYEYLFLCERQEKKKDAKGYEEYEDWEHKKGVPKELIYLLFSFYETQPIAGAVRATGVLSAAARSRGKL